MDFTVVGVNNTKKTREVVHVDTATIEDAEDLVHMSNPHFLIGAVFEGVVWPDDTRENVGPNVDYRRVLGFDSNGQMLALT